MKQFKEAIDVNTDPDFIDPSKRDRIESGKLGYEPLMPDQDTTHEVASISYKEAIDKLRRYAPNVPNDHTEAIEMIMGMLQVLMQIKNVENYHNEYLEMLALETILNLPEFKVVQEAYDADNIRFDIQLIELTFNVDFDEMSEEFEEIEQSTEFETFEDEMNFMLADVEEEVRKRRMQNVFTQGAASNYLYLFEYVRNELSSLSPDLPDLYGIITAIGDFAQWVVPEIIGDAQPMGAGEVELDFEEDEIPTIRAKAVNFPLLCHEIVKGILEYMSVHGMPNSPKVRDYVLSRADQPEIEPYDLMLGKEFWNRLVNVIGRENSSILFHVYEKIMAMPAVDHDIKESFGYFIKLFLEKPEEAKKITQQFATEINQAIQDYENGTNI